MKVYLMEDILGMVDREKYREAEKPARRKMVLEKAYSLGEMLDKGDYKGSPYFVIKEKKRAKQD